MTVSATVPRPARPLVTLIVFQCLCMVFFLFDLAEDLASGTDPLAHMLPEFAATFGLIIGIVFEVVVLRDLNARARAMKQGIDVASGALARVIEGYFTTWRLTAAERDVALFTIKGFSIAEIAGLRESAEGTVKTHLNAIYRKAGVPGRAQLVSLLVEDLLGGPLIDGPGAKDRQKPADPTAIARP